MNRRILTAMVWSLLGVSVVVSGSVVVRAVVTEDPSARSPDPSSSQPPPGEPGAQLEEHPAKPAYAPGQVILKLKPGAASKIAEALEYGRMPEQPPQAGSLNERFQVHGLRIIRRVFPALEKRNAQGRVLRVIPTEELVQAAKARHPQRAQRAPEGAAIPRLEDFVLLEFPQDADVPELCEQFRKHPDDVEACQPNYLVKTQWIPNDPYYHSCNSWGQGCPPGGYDDLWGLKKLQLEQAWNSSRGQGIVVAVIDSGLDYTHPDIAANVWVNPGEDLNRNGRVDGANTCPTPSGDFNCFDDDGNGYIDDIRGWDVTTCEYFDYTLGRCVMKAPDNDPVDDFGHGTHVAGTIAAVGHNSLGIIGVAPQAKVMPLKALNLQGDGVTTELAEALVYAAENGADVLNNSWGCARPCPSNPVAEDAVRLAHGLGAVVVFAAGNSSMDVIHFSPQNMRDAKPIVVGATVHWDYDPPLDKPSFFTNFGFWVDVGAPGGGPPVVPDFPVFSYRDILSLKSAVTFGLFYEPNDPESPALLVGDQYLRTSGTSMAAPHAAGIAALVLARHPSFTSEEVRQVLRASADDANFTGFDLKTGAGRLNAARAVAVDRPLQAKLISPALLPAEANPWPTVDPGRGPVSITGTAAGGGFQQYQLFYAPDPTLHAWPFPVPITQLSSPLVRGQLPQSWNAIGAPAASLVEQGLLGTWAIGGLGTDRYLIKLVASSLGGWVFEDFAQLIVEDDVRPLPSGVSSSIDDISGTRIVWIGPSEGSSFPHLFCLDLQTGAVHQVTADPARPASAAISGDWIVWEDSRNGNSDIYAANLNTMEGERPVTTDPANQRFPAISGTRIVWQDDRNGTWDTYLYDLATGGPERQLHSSSSTFDLYHHLSPVISENWVVWFYDIYGTRGWGDDSALGFYNLTEDRERVRVTLDTISRPDLALSGNQLVVGEISGAIAVYELENPFGTWGASKRQLTNGDTTRGYSPDISGDLLVWSGVQRGQYDIVLHDLQTSHRRWLTAAPTHDLDPVISGERVVWARDDADAAYLYAPNRNPPVLAPIGDQRAVTGEPLVFSVSATDPDQGPLSFGATGLPVGAAFTGQTFSWTPRFDQVGDAHVTFTVSDGEMGDSETITISVTYTNHAPILAPIGDRTIREDYPLSFTISATDTDGQPLGYSATNLPLGALFDPASQTFAWRPDCAQAGTYPNVTFTVSDGTATDSEAVVITVMENVCVTSLTAAPNPFSPNGDGTNDTVTISGAFDRSVDQWRVAIYDFPFAGGIGGLPLRSFIGGQAVSVSVVWDGKDSRGTRAPDRGYTYTLAGSITSKGEQAALRSGTVTVDTTPPALANVSPVSGSSTTNRFQSFSATASDTVQLGRAVLKRDGLVVQNRTLTGTSASISYTPSTAFSYASHTYSLQVWDAAGNTVTASTTFTVYYSSGGGGGGCFLPGTPVTLADGTTKPIEQVQVGEALLEYDETTQTFVPGVVQRVFIIQGETEYLTINGRLQVTPHHRFLINGVWKPAEGLVVGDHLLKAEGTPESITSIERTQAQTPLTVYHLQTNPAATFVAGGVVVHNMRFEDDRVRGYAALPTK